VNDILQQNLVGVAMEGVNLGRNGQLCWVQVHTALLTLCQTTYLLSVCIQYMLGYCHQSWSLHQSVCLSVSPWCKWVVPEH